MLGCLTLSLMLQGCSTASGLIQRKITVVDEAGVPIAGAGTFPQPFVYGPKQSGKNGSLRVYGFSPISNFRINAPGYENGEFRFSQEDSYCVLKRKMKPRAKH